jgi:hypothetical protein
LGEIGDDAGDFVDREFARHGEFDAAGRLVGRSRLLQG